jgi:hypothetical protein
LQADDSGVSQGFYGLYDQLEKASDLLREIGRKCTEGLFYQISSSDIHAANTPALWAHSLFLGIQLIGGFRSVPVHYE